MTQPTPATVLGALARERLFDLSRIFGVARQDLLAELATAAGLDTSLDPAPRPDHPRRLAAGPSASMVKDAPPCRYHDPATQHNNLRVQTDACRIETAFVKIGL